MPPVGFEPTISAGERPRTYALDLAATGTGYPFLVPWSRKGTANTSTPLMGRTPCTEPQCLYKCALYQFAFYLIGLGFVSGLFP